MQMPDITKVIALRVGDDEVEAFAKSFLLRAGKKTLILPFVAGELQSPFNAGFKGANALFVSDLR